MSFALTFAQLTENLDEDISTHIFKFYETELSFKIIACLKEAIECLTTVTNNPHEHATSRNNAEINITFIRNILRFIESNPTDQFTRLGKGWRQRINKFGRTKKRCVNKETQTLPSTEFTSQSNSQTSTTSAEYLESTRNSTVIVPNFPTSRIDIATPYCHSLNQLPTYLQSPCYPLYPNITPVFAEQNQIYSQLPLSKEIIHQSPNNTLTPYRNHKRKSFFPDYIPYTTSPPQKITSQSTTITEEQNETPTLLNTTFSISN